MNWKKKEKKIRGNKLWAFVLKFYADDGNKSVFQEIGGDKGVDLIIFL